MTFDPDQRSAPMPPAPQAPPPHPYTQQARPLNALAIVAFIASLFVSLAGIICGHIALSQIKRRQEGGRGFALAGVIIGYVGLAVKLSIVASLIVFGLNGFGSAGGQNAAGGAGDSGGPSVQSTGAQGPEGMASGGAVFGEGSTLVSSGASSGDKRTPFFVDRDSDPVDVTIYVDYMCPACGAFEAEYGDDLTEAVERGDITVQVYPLNFLDPTSQGSRYSTRAANLFACTVENAPDSAFSVHTALLDPRNQPHEGTKGLSNTELLAIAESAGAKVTPEMQQCVEAVPFAQFFDDNTVIATQVGLLGLAEGARLNDMNGNTRPANEPQTLLSTPTVIVSGEEYVSMRDGDFAAFLKAAIEEHGAR